MLPLLLGGRHMKTSIMRGTVGVVLVLCTGLTFAGDGRRAAGFGKKHGVAEYEIKSKTRGAVALDILATDGKLLAEAKVVVLPKGAVRLEAKSAAKETIRMLWDLGNGRIEVGIGSAKASKQLNAEKTAFDAEGDVYVRHAQRDSGTTCSGHCGYEPGVAGPGGLRICARHW